MSAGVSDGCSSTGCGLTAMNEPQLPRQTLTFLRRRFEQAGIRPRGDLGQNFLIDLNLLRVLVDVAEVGQNDVVLEVGAGTGALTAMLAEQAAQVLSVEVDRDLYRLAGETLAELPNVRLLNQDALKNKNHLHPQLLGAMEEELAGHAQARFKLVANLPYHVATPLISNLLALDRPPHTMTVTTQRELAERIVARPRLKGYGALSVWVQSQCRARIVRPLPPSAFWPRPKVFSSIVHIAYDPRRRDRIDDREFFHQFVRRLFLHRRKFLRAQVLSALDRKTPKDRIDAVLAELGIDPQCRAEELDVEAMLRLSDAVRPLVARS